MNILFATAQPFPPQIMGGMQRSAHELITRMKNKGHNVSLLCSLTGTGTMGIRGRILLKLTGNKTAHDTHLGYPTYRAWFPWEGMEEVAKKFKPDVVVVFCGKPVRVALEAKKLNLPIVMMLQNVEFKDHEGDFNELGPVPCVANSQFTADRYQQAYGVEPSVIHPMVDGVAQYQTPTTRENITFINPHPVKGTDIAIALAKACPEIPFVFQLAWTLEKDDRAKLMQELASAPNVTLRKPVRNMKEVYGSCKILLAPSRWEEAYGRVATEPQFSGIPVIASRRGGLPEAVGEGGVVLDLEDPIEKWVEATKRLWNDDEYYNTLSEAALKHANRPALNLETQANMWEEAITHAASSREA